ncbi:hypothetical protein DVR12_26995 [Chitinophaga silvatica]|uniref:Uncharacterized protein n=1 Tax=Chitinophaga silvatica TaxID=2282649 RepID=A0A3E1Y1Y3_9BACT|nr:hypothetical protein [Chitinophaga silvatica]RFS18695.1 hypothetical protein DVR12_26995 [Chitinophaga silvatica]
MILLNFFKTIFKKSKVRKELNTKWLDRLPCQLIDNVLKEYTEYSMEDVLEGRMAVLGNYSNERFKHCINLIETGELQLKDYINEPLSYNRDHIMLISIKLKSNNYIFVVTIYRYEYLVRGEYVKLFHLSKKQERMALDLATVVGVLNCDYKLD